MARAIRKMERTAEDFTERVREAAFGVFYGATEPSALQRKSPKRLAIPAPVVSIDIDEIQVNAFWRNAE